MCDQLVWLARINEERYIMCCEHGVTHIIWGSVSIRIPTNELSDIASQLHQAAQLAAQYRIASNYLVTVICNQHDQFQLWIRGGGLHLMPDDFQLFVKMMQQAGNHPLAQKMASEKDASSESKEERPFQVPPKLYSVN
ncbi:MAG: hypothetical protein AAF702_06380 [Chloroflexota bacterium]